MKVALWGPRGAGKTTYITMVYGTPILSDDYKWVIRPNSIESMAFVEDNFVRIRDGQFPIPNENLDPLYYSYVFMPGGFNKRTEEKKIDSSDPVIRFRNWLAANDAKLAHQDNVNNFSQLEVEFADVAGEAFLNADLDSELWQHLAKCDGLVCLLDPTNADDHFKITFRLLQYLWMILKDQSGGLDRGMLKHHIAFCFSKIDSDDYSGFINDPLGLIDELQRRDGLNIDRLLRQFVQADRLEYFTITAVGADAGVSNGNIENPRAIKPINVLEPLHWLFKAMGN